MGGIDPLPLTGLIAVIQRAQDGQRIAIGAHPIQIRISPAHRHRRFRQAGHVALTAERRRYRADRSHAAIRAKSPHAGLLDIDNIRPDLLHDVIAKTQPRQHARRKPLCHHIANTHQILGNLQALGVADIQRNAALAGVLVVELAAHVGVLQTDQRAGGGIAGGPATDRRHRRQAGIGVVFPLHLVAFRPHRREAARAASGRQEPGEIENFYPLQRKRLAVQRRNNGVVIPAWLGWHAGLAGGLLQHRLSVFAKQRRATADLPTGGGGQPFAGRITEAAAVLGVMHIRE